MKVLDGRLWLSPSDVTAYLACEHLTALSLQVARGELPEPPPPGDRAELVFRKGLEHERAYLERLRDDGLAVTEIELEDGDWARAVEETQAALRAGVDVVYQAVLVGDGWRGVTISRSGRSALTRAMKSSVSARLFCLKTATSTPSMASRATSTPRSEMIGWVPHRNRLMPTSGRKSRSKANGAAWPHQPDSGCCAAA